MKIKIELDGLTLDQATDLTNFLSSLKKEANKDITYEREPIEDYVERAFTKEEKPKATRKKAEKVEVPQQEEMPDWVDPTPEATEAESTTVDEAETVTAPTLMQIRSLVAKKAAQHKDAIKSKLVERGAQNVSTLDAKHFQTIFDFLNSL